MFILQLLPLTWKEQCDAKQASLLKYSMEFPLLSLSSSSTTLNIRFHHTLLSSIITTQCYHPLIAPN